MIVVRDLERGNVLLWRSGMIDLVVSASRNDSGIVLRLLCLHDPVKDFTEGNLGTYSWALNARISAEVLR